MSNKIDIVGDEVTKAYESTTRKQAKYLWKYHVQVVANYAEQLSKQFGANPDLAVAGALLHDISDIWMERNDTQFEESVLRNVQGILKTAKYTPQEITFVADQVIAPHSCYPNHLPTALEGKVLATADAMAHLTTHFYKDIRQLFFARLTDEEYKEWVGKKLERDFNSKIFFPEIKAQVEPKYKELIEWKNKLA